LTTKGFQALADDYMAHEKSLLDFLDQIAQGNRSLVDRWIMKRYGKSFEQIKQELTGAIQQLGKMDLERYRQYELDKKLGHIYVGGVKAKKIEGRD